MEEDILLETLIQKQKSRIPRLRRYVNYYSYPDMGNYHKLLATTKRYIEIKCPQDKYVTEFN